MLFQEKMVNYQEEKLGGMAEMNKIFHKHREKPIVHKRRSAMEKVWFTIGFVIFFLYATSIIVYFGWAFKCSLMNVDEFFNNPMAFPAQLKFENYKHALKELSDPNSGTNFFGMIFNGLWFSIGSTVLSTFSVTITGYIFAKYEFNIKRLMINVTIFTMIIPIIGNMSSYFNLIFSVLNIDNSPLYLITCLGGFGGNFLITMSYYRGVDNAYREAAYIDGANDYQVLFMIMLPMAKGIMFAFGILGFMGGWNDYMTPIIYLDQMPTVASGLYTFKMQMQYAANDPVYFAGTILAMLPPLILFASFSDKIMGSIVMGGLKG